MQGQYLVIGNVGDSRAVLGTRDKEDSLVAVQLTVDLKPNLPGIYNFTFIVKFFGARSIHHDGFLSREFCALSR